MPRVYTTCSTGVLHRAYDGGVSSTDPDERRIAIIRAVWQTIAESGMGAVSMRTVAAASGVSVGGIQYWFHSRDELLRDSLQVMLTEAATRHTAASGAADDRQALWHLISQPIPLAAGAPAGVSVFHHYVAAGINHPVLAEMLARAKDGQESEVARLLGRITPGSGDHREAARSLIALSDGLTIRVLIGGLTGAEAELTLRNEVDRLAPETKR